MVDEILASLLLRPGMEGKDMLLRDMITDCLYEIRDVINYPDTENIPVALKGAIKELVLTKYNRDGSQGLQSESQSSGGSVTYMTDLPQTIKRQIYRYRRFVR